MYLEPSVETHFRFAGVNCLLLYHCHKSYLV
jgi:hypothetical protein